MVPATPTQAPSLLLMDPIPGSSSYWKIVPTPPGNPFLFFAFTVPNLLWVLFFHLKQVSLFWFCYCFLFWVAIYHPRWKLLNLNLWAQMGFILRVPNDDFLFLFFSSFIFTILKKGESKIHIFFWLLKIYIFSKVSLLNHMGAEEILIIMLNNVKSEFLVLDDLY